MRWGSATSPSVCAAPRRSARPRRGALRRPVVRVRGGFCRGTPDGQLLGQTREALRGFQASIGAPADGFASSDVLEGICESQASRIMLGANPENVIFSPY